MQRMRKSGSFRGASRYSLVHSIGVAPQASSHPSSNMSTGSSTRRKPSSAPSVRPARIALSKIQLPQPGALVPAAGSLRPPPDLVATTDVLDVVSYLYPPLLVEAEGIRGSYIVVGNARTIQWRMQLAATNGEADARILSLILREASPDVVARLGVVERYLVPMLLGTLKSGEARTASKGLRRMGIRVPRQVATRDQLQRLANRSKSHG